MTMRIEGQCANCEQMATEEILCASMMEYLNVCDECFKKVFTDVVNEGIGQFYEWASEMYGDRKAFELCKEIYGEKAVKAFANVDSKEDEMVSIFTYGILKYRHNIEREGGQNIIENSTVSGHKMHLYNNSFPITMKSDNQDDIVYGTLFDVPLSVLLHQYDFIEGYNPKANPKDNMYNRIEVEVTTPTGEKKKAQMYLANSISFKGWYNRGTIIRSGNFDDRHTALTWERYGKRRGK
jgi:gamma-glutamylcyclotransferase (GGCT)/AIG2-like uncharacterized protein YtfP